MEKNEIIGEKFLPIGTVCRLKEAEKSLMIIGYCVTDIKTGLRFDYAGVLFPEGLITLDETMLFNHDKIETVYYEGYRNDEQQALNDALIEYAESALKIDEDVKKELMDDDESSVEEIDGISFDAITGDETEVLNLTDEDTNALKSFNGDLFAPPIFKD